MSSPVSLIATVKDEGDSIRPFLEGLLAQSRPPEEIVLADGGSTDSTVAEIESARDRSSVPIRLVDAPGTNISEGRNAAISEASHDLIAVTDAGTRPNGDWLERLVQPLESDEAASVSSGFFLPGGEGWRKRALAIAITPQAVEIDPETFLPSSRSVAFRRDWWQRVGGYPEWLLHCEDLVFDLDLRSAGASFVFVPDSIVVWDARPDLRSFARQYFNYARGDGHANLWPKRHLARYAAYLVGLGVLSRRRSRATLLALALGWLGYQSRFFRRLLRVPASEKPSEQLAALAYVPAIVTVGDAAKIVGYAVGSWERLTDTAPAGRRPQ